MSDAVASTFGRVEIADAIKLCFERPESFVREYVETTFSLDPDPTEAAIVVTGDVDQDEGRAGGQVTFVEELGDEEWSDLSDDEGLGLEELWEAQKSSRHGRRKVGIMQRLATEHGFRVDGAGTFQHPDGRRIIHASEVFPWQEYDQHGELIRQYWAKAHCLELKPLEIASEVWNMLEAEPDGRSLVLADRKGAPVELPGSRVVELKTRGDLKLFPAAYRIRLERTGS